MPEKILETSRITISNGRVSELLCLKVMEKLSMKNGDYLQYLLIKKGYVIIKKFDVEEEEIIRQTEEKR